MTMRRLRMHAHGHKKVSREHSLPPVVWRAFNLVSKKNQELPLAFSKLRQIEEEVNIMPY